MAFLTSPTELAEAFRARRLRVTPQRQLLFSLLEHNIAHPTALGRFARASAQLPGISLRTVSTTLTDLVDLGELRSVFHGTWAACVGTDLTTNTPNTENHHG